MALLSYLYKDLALSQQFDDSVDSVIVAALNGSSGTGVFYVGVPTASKKIQAASDPGVDDIEISIVDSATGTGVDELDIKLATSEANLALAVAGDPVSLGSEVVNGTPREVWVQWSNATGSGQYTEISLEVAELVEVAV